MYFEEVKTIGKTPDSRTKHTMCYNEIINMIVLHAGDN